jgi:hypothetical protein
MLAVKTSIFSFFFFFGGERVIVLGLSFMFFMQEVGATSRKEKEKEIQKKIKGN